MVGKCDLPTVYRRITDAVKLANNKAKGNDWNTTFMDICVCDGCVTLPADVGTVLAINQGGSPSVIRDQWYQYHINGSGIECGPPCGYSNELGPVVTFKDPSEPVKLVAEVENSLDSNVGELRVFGWDEDGKRIYTAGAGGVLEDGFLVPLIYGFAAPNPAAPDIARIDRIKKSLTNGFIRLIAVDSSTLATHTLIGHYQPWETVPSYRRIRVGDYSWVRVKYRRKDQEVRSSADWINIENREALLMFIRAVKVRLDGKLEEARAFEDEAGRLLSEEASSLRPPSLQSPQIIIGTYPYDDDRLFG